MSDKLEMDIEDMRTTLQECLITLRHARSFVTTSKKMNEHQIERFDSMIDQVEETLGSIS